MVIIYSVFTEEFVHLPRMRYKASYLEGTTRSGVEAFFWWFRFCVIFYLSTESLEKEGILGLLGRIASSLSHNKRRD
jgi:hypothetical protein